jgi:hypothetical protein
MEMKWTERGGGRKAKEEREAAEMLCLEGEEKYEELEKKNVRKAKSKVSATWKRIAANAPSHICIGPDEIRIDAQFEASRWFSRGTTPKESLDGVDWDPFA